ncbi:TOBE domain-containing protein [Acidovorax sp. NCPPB 3576]|uniref:TOBE domain-containing protein n=1 Tax=Acidovorax sp. NCPPB 3576 TaxID=2940488 RepID=UPI002349FA1F|nr:TOBE domain-containing protein [Acidovorax sp. NCPPB 3576]WCM86936.1 TOBE domain-containing protein [Acidovorax sp. NCPPB 3576]
MTKRLSLSDALGQGMADRRIDILRQIGVGGSISQAARAVGVSYKAAWQAVDALTNLAGVPLVARAVGGTGGGGAQLTPAGLELLNAADALEEARREVLARLAPGPAGAPALARLALRTSLRNQWPCTVQSLEPLGPLVRVHLQGESAPDLALCARITRESAELLALRAGLPVLALCKAAAVRVHAGWPQALASNAWPARASRVSRGPAGDEVSATLNAGVHMVGFAPPSSGLRARGRVSMAVDESAVVLAVTG